MDVSSTQISDILNELREINRNLGATSYKEILRKLKETGFDPLWYRSENENPA